VNRAVLYGDSASRKRAARRSGAAVQFPGERIPGAPVVVDGGMLARLM